MCISMATNPNPPEQPTPSPTHDLFPSPRVMQKKPQAKLEIEVLKSKSHKSQMSQVKSECQTVYGFRKRIPDCGIRK